MKGTLTAFMHAALIGCRADRLPQDNYGEFLMDAFSTNPCGIIVPKSPGDNRNGFTDCIRMCEDSGIDFARENGCYTLEEAFENTVLHHYLRTVPVIALPSSYTMSQCAKSCEDHPDCDYWQYGPAHDPNGHIIPKNSDSETEEYAKKNTLVMCLHSSYEAIGNSDRFPFNFMNWYGQCGNDVFELLQDSWIFWDDSDVQGAVTVSAFINGKSFEDNCPNFYITTTPTTTTTTTTTTKTTPLTSVVSECQEKITASDPSRIEDCRLKCALYYPPGPLSEFCKDIIPTASALIECIGNQTHYCFEREAN